MVNYITHHFGRINGVAVLARVFFYRKMHGSFCQVAKTKWP